MCLLENGTQMWYNELDKNYKIGGAYMAAVKVTILKIVDTSYPIFVEFELVDAKGASHYFIDKVPVVSGDDELVPPCVGYMRCNIINETENTFIIDTALPDDIASKDGKYVFEVNKDRII